MLLGFGGFLWSLLGRQLNQVIKQRIGGVLEGLITQGVLIWIVDIEGLS